MAAGAARRSSISGPGALRRAVIDGDVENGSLMAGPVGRHGHRANSRSPRSSPNWSARPKPRSPGGRRLLRIGRLMPPASAARTILRRLHEVMAARTGAEAKLGQVVRIVANELSSEVASIYLLRDGMLELFATRGLAQEAVHVTKLSIGAGPGRRHRCNARAAQSRRGAGASRFRPSPRNWRRQFPQLRRRPHRAARGGDRRARRPASRAARL